MKQSELYHSPELTFLGSLDNDFLYGIVAPFDFGFDCGVEWVETASLEAIHIAAIRRTINEQMDDYDILYDNYELSPYSSPASSELAITRPTDQGDGCHPEIGQYFQEMLKHYFYLNNPTKHMAMSGLTYDSTKYLNSHFKDFEDGWTKAVRIYYRDLLMSCRDQLDGKNGFTDENIVGPCRVCRREVVELEDRYLCIKSFIGKCSFTLDKDSIRETLKMNTDESIHDFILNSSKIRELVSTLLHKPSLFASNIRTVFKHYKAQITQDEDGKWGVRITRNDAELLSSKDLPKDGTL